MLLQQRHKLNCGSDRQNLNLESLQHVAPGCRWGDVCISAALYFLFLSNHAAPKNHPWLWNLSLTLISVATWPNRTFNPSRVSVLHRKAIKCRLLLKGRIKYSALLLTVKTSNVGCCPSNFSKGTKAYLGK